MRILLLLLLALSAHAETGRNQKIGASLTVKGPDGLHFTQPGVGITWQDGSTSTTAVTGGGGSGPATPGAYVHIEYTMPNGENGGGGAIAAWTAIPINTKITDTGSDCTIVDSSFTLTAGTWRLTGTQYLFYGYQTGLRLWNVTDDALLVQGMSSGEYNGNNGITSPIYGRFTISGTKTLALQYYVTHVADTQTLGINCSTGNDEVYGSFIFEKE